MSRQHHQLHTQPPTATGLRGFAPPHTFASALCAVILQSLLPVVSMSTKLRDFLQHPHFLLKSRFFFIGEEDSSCCILDKQ